jgi:hypothetical protein
LIVTRIRPLSLAKVTTPVCAAIGLFIGAIFAGISLVGAAIGLAAQGGSEHNMAARAIGGVEFEVQDR